MAEGFITRSYNRGGGGSGNVNIFTGTLAEWNLLSPAQKASYTHLFTTDPVTTLAGYGITNAYTKDEVDALIGGGGGNSTVRYDENTRYMQVLDHGRWVNAYKVHFEYFVKKYFTTENPINKTYTFTEDGKYLVWANTCVNESSPTSKMSTTATVISQNNESKTELGYYRVCEYMIVDAVVGDTVTIAASSYNKNSVGVIQLANDLTLSEYAFELEVDGTAHFSKTYAVNDRYLVLLLPSGRERSISGNGNMEQSWSDDVNSIDFIERNTDTVSYSAYGYGGGAGTIIVFTVS